MGVVRENERIIIMILLRRIAVDAEQDVSGRQQKIQGDVASGLTAINNKHQTGRITDHPSVIAMARSPPGLPHLPQPPFSGRCR